MTKQLFAVIGIAARNGEVVGNLGFVVAVSRAEAEGLYLPRLKEKYLFSLGYASWQVAAFAVPKWSDEVAKCQEGDSDAETKSPPVL